MISVPSDDELPPLTDQDVSTLAWLLARYATHELDQFDHWRVDTPIGTAYVELSNEPRPDIAPELYTRIWPLPPHLAGH